MMLPSLLALLALPAAYADALEWIPTATQAPPMRLTAADGVGLALTELRARAVVDEPLAYTELHLVFDNPHPRQIEGRFEITLPTGAAISRFAMQIGDAWQEGEVVELQAARRAYEDFLHQRTDPALLEHDAGNVFRARVFPIEPNSRKELKIAWSHDLDEGEGWSLPTGGLPELGLFQADVWVGGERHRYVTEHAVPEGDLTMRLAPTGAIAARGPEHAVIRFTPALDVGRDPVRDAVVWVDTSASRALSFEAMLADLAQVVPTFGGDVVVRAFDQDVQAVYEGPARGFGQGAIDALRARGAMGASDPRWIARGSEGAERVIVFTDGVQTAGEDQALLAALEAAQVGRVDAVLRGGARDPEALARWVALGRRDGVVLDADVLAPAEVARRLGLGTAGRLEVAVDGAGWVQPRELRGLQPGDSVTVYAELERGAPLALSLGGRPVGRVEEHTSDGPLLRRASAQAEIGALLHAKAAAPDPAARAALIERIVEVSTTHRVLSPHTALLVLETEADYARFGIPRDALADILVVAESGALRWERRGGVVVADAGSAVDAPVDDERVDDTPPAQAKEAKSAPASPRPEPMVEAEEAARPRGRVEAERAARRQAEAERSGSPPPPPPPSGPPAADRDEELLAEPPMERAAAEQDSTDRVSRAPEDAWTGRYAEVMAQLAAGELARAEALAVAWRDEAPGDPLAWLALGEVWQRQGRLAEAARAYGSLIDLFPSRADLRRTAGQRLTPLGDAGMELAIDTFLAAVEQRPDHPSSHRLAAWALARAGRHAEAIDLLRRGLEQRFERFEAAHQILREDASLIAAMWRTADPWANVSQALKGMQVEPASGPELRFVLSWETDANDVDFHIRDAKGGHAYYSERELPSGGQLYADVTTGYGPECFRIDRPSAYPYTLEAHYYRQGPMGFGMGTLQVIAHDGVGGVTMEERPFVVMRDGAYVQLGEVGGPSGG